MATTLTVSSLKNYINAGLNVLISGVHGVGKTAKLVEATNSLGLKMKYYSASTLDPYTDLTGIPVPNTENKTVEYFRPHAIDEAEVIFFDEINRADPKTLNTLLEIILNHSINGEPLPKLKAVVAAMNPVTEDYNTDELDKAIMDRFQIFLSADAEIDTAYFVTRFGDSVGTAAVAWWNEYHTAVKRSQGNAGRGNVVPYLSPRRMEMVVAAYLAISNRQTVADCLPPEITDASVAVNIYRTLKAAVDAEKNQATGGFESKVKAITNAPIADQRKDETGLAAGKLLAAGLPDELRARLASSLAIALNGARKSPETIMANFGEVVKVMTPTNIGELTTGWNPGKLNTFNRLLADLKK